MGCFWSSQTSYERCMRCGRKGVNNLRITDDLCEVCISQATRLEAYRSKTYNQPSADSQGTYLGCGPFFGEYRCSCGHRWISRRSWPGNWQLCEKTTCRRQVYAYTQRALRDSDWADAKNAEKHRKELCQKCQQLGRDCKSFENKINSAKTKTFSTHKKSRARSRTYYPSLKRTTTSSAHTKTYRSWTKANRKL